MLTCLLYHGWGIRGYEYVHTRYEADKIIFKIRQTGRLRYACYNYRHHKATKKGFVTRQFKMPPIGFAKEIRLELDVQRINCSKCGITRQVKIPFAKPKKQLRMLLNAVFLRFPGI